VTIVISGTYGLSNFREDLQKLYKRAGVKGEGLMFLLTDSQIVDERMLVYINDLLASGEIPDLFAQVRVGGGGVAAHEGACGGGGGPLLCAATHGAHCGLQRVGWRCRRTATRSSTHCAARPNR
jgi:hypothetical protein